MFRNVEMKKKQKIRLSAALKQDQKTDWLFKYASSGRGNENVEKTG